MPNAPGLEDLILLRNLSVISLECNFNENLVGFDTIFSTLNTIFCTGLKKYLGMNEINQTKILFDIFFMGLRKVFVVVVVFILKKKSCSRHMSE